MDGISGDSDTEPAVLGNTRIGLIRSLVQKYHPGLEVVTDVKVEGDDTYYGEWEGGTLYFTTECENLSDKELTYVALHEIAHALTQSGYHRDCFYGVLTALVISEGISWATAIHIEQVTPKLWETYRLLTESVN